MLGIGADRPQGLGGGLKEQVVDHRFVLIGDRRDLLGQGEDHVEVRAVEQFGLAMLDPFRPGQRLAFWTMPISARVIGDALVRAGIAPFQVTAQGSGATRFNSDHHTTLRARQGRLVLGTIRLAVAAQHLRHLQGGPLHGPECLERLGRWSRRRWQRAGQQSQRTLGRADSRGGDAQVARRRGE